MKTLNGRHNLNCSDQWFSTCQQHSSGNANDRHSINLKQQQQKNIESLFWHRLNLSIIISWYYVLLFLLCIKKQLLTGRWISNFIFSIKPDMFVNPCVLLVCFMFNLNTRLNIFSFFLLEILNDCYYLIWF